MEPQQNCHNHSAVFAALNEFIYMINVQHIEKNQHSMYGIEEYWNKSTFKLGDIDNYNLIIAVNSDTNDFLIPLGCTWEDGRSGLSEPTNAIRFLLSTNSSAPKEVILIHSDESSSTFSETPFNLIFELGERGIEHLSDYEVTCLKALITSLGYGSISPDSTAQKYINTLKVGFNF